MVIKEYYMSRRDGVRLVRNYSDQNVCIKNELGEIYEEAIDPENILHTYEETDIPIEHPEPPEEPQQPQFGIPGMIPPMTPNIPTTPTTPESEE